MPVGISYKVCFACEFRCHNLVVKLFTDGWQGRNVPRVRGAPKAGVRPTFVKFMQTPAVGEMHNIMNSSREKRKKERPSRLRPSELGMNRTVSLSLFVSGSSYILFIPSGELSY